MIILGYIINFGYIFLLIFGLGEVLRKRGGVEDSRKVIHMGLFAVWVFLDLFFRGTIHQILLPLAFLVLNSLSYKFKIYKSVEREDNNHFGTIYFAAAVSAIMIVSYFRESLYICTGAAVFCLTFGDGAAALAGQHIPSRRITESKTLAGFFGCFAASLISLLAFKLIWWQELTLWAVALLALTAAVTELVGKGLDNFTVTFSVFGLSRLLTGPDGAAAGLSLAAALAVFLVVFFSGAITLSGSLLSAGMVFCFSYWGGGPGLGLLLGTYFIIFAVSRLRKKLQPSAAKHDRRGFLQILINGGLGTAAILLFGLTGQKDWFLVSLTAIGGCFVDSLSSDVGVLSKKQPWDPIRRAMVEAGLSGGMTALGTGAAAAGAVVLGLFGWLIVGASFADAAMAAALILAQSLLDTVLGSTLQVKFRCPRCGRITEYRSHCQTNTVHASGLPWLTNNAVNLLTSAAITLIAVLIFV